MVLSSVRRGAGMGDDMRTCVTLKKCDTQAPVNQVEDSSVATRNFEGVPQTG